MKKTYNKPEIYAESLKLKSSVVRTCEDAADWWDVIEFEEPDGSMVYVFVADVGMGCTVNDHDYMSNHGDDDSTCYYSYVSDGKTFTS